MLTVLTAFIITPNYCTSTTEAIKKANEVIIREREVWHARQSETRPMSSEETQISTWRPSPSLLSQNIIFFGSLSKSETFLSVPWMKSEPSKSKYNLFPSYGD